MGSVAFIVNSRTTITIVSSAAIKFYVLRVVGTHSTPPVATDYFWTPGTTTQIPGSGTHSLTLDPGVYGLETAPTSSSFDTNKAERVDMPQDPWPAPPPPPPPNFTAIGVTQTETTWKNIIWRSKATGTPPSTNDTMMFLYPPYL